MNRRTFLQSMAAAFAAVASGVRLSEALARPPIDYSLFVCDDGWLGHRYDLDQPFSVDGSIYATDSRVLVTHPGEWNGDGKARIPDVGKLWWDEFDSAGWQPLGAPVKVPHEHGAYCPECRGEGVVGRTVACGRCLGEGEIIVDWDLGVCERCPDCINGKIGAKCPAGCERGWIKWRERIDGGLFCPDHMGRVRTLGDLDVRVIHVPYDKRSTGGNVLLFRGANDVRGMLMGMTK